MFKSRTVFIVGAGASYEVGLPIGAALAGQIGGMADMQFEHGLRHVRGDLELFKGLTNNLRQETTEFQQAGWIIRDGIVLAHSIDDFLSIHESNARVKLYGKAAIAKAVLDAERSSKLHWSNVNGEVADFRKLSDTWFVKFMRMVAPGVLIPNVTSLFENVSFIVFNYDRCVEQFLRHAIGRLYNLTEPQTRAVYSKAKIFHPYGFLGDLETVPFGASHTDYVEVASRIRTYAERIDEGDELTEIRKIIADAETLVFLGFAFHGQNMDLILPIATRITPKRVFATALNFSSHDCQYVRQRLADVVTQGRELEMFDDRYVHIRNDKRCTDLFDEYRMTMPSVKISR